MKHILVDFENFLFVFLILLTLFYHQKFLQLLIQVFENVTNLNIISTLICWLTVAFLIGIKFALAPFVRKKFNIPIPGELFVVNILFITCETFFKESLVL